MIGNSIRNSLYSLLIRAEPGITVRLEFVLSPSLTLVITSWGVLLSLFRWGQKWISGKKTYLFQIPAFVSFFVCLIHNILHRRKAPTHRAYWTGDAGNIVNAIFTAAYKAHYFMQATFQGIIFFKCGTREEAIAINRIDNSLKNGLISFIKGAIDKNSVFVFRRFHSRRKDYAALVGRIITGVSRAEILFFTGAVLA